VLLRSDPSADEVVANGVCQWQVVVPRSGDVAVLHYGVVDMTAKRLLDVGDVLDDSDATHTNLLAPVLIRLHLSSHFVTATTVRVVVFIRKRSQTAPIPSDDPARCSRP